MAAEGAPDAGISAGAAVPVGARWVALAQPMSAVAIKAWGIGPGAILGP